MKGRKAVAYLAFAIVCVVWGTTYLAIRIAIETLPTLLFPGLRYTIAGAVLLALCVIKGEKLPTRIADWGNLALIGFLLIGIGNVAVVWAEHNVSSGFAALLVATSPFWMAILESFRRNGDRISMRRGIGMVIGFIGVAILVFPGAGASKFDKLFLLGVLVLQLGNIAWNLGSIRSKYHPIEASPLVAAAIQMLSGGVIVTMIGLAAGEGPHFHFNPRTLTAFLYLVVFGSIVAYGSYVYALAHLRTSTVSLYAYVNPAIAVVVGFLILNEPIGPAAIVAMLVIFAGVALVQSSPKQRKVPEPADV